MNDEIKLGELIYNEIVKNPKNKFMDNARKICKDENKARRSYWLYIFFIKCDLKNFLIENEMEYILNNYSSYKIMNYVILFKEEVLNEFDIQENFKKYFRELFLKSYSLSEKDLRIFIKNEMIKKTEIFKKLKEENNNLKMEVKRANEDILENNLILERTIAELSRINQEFHILMQNKEELKLIAEKIHYLSIIIFLLCITLITALFKFK